MKPRPSALLVLACLPGACSLDDPTAITPIDLALTNRIVVETEARGTRTFQRVEVVDKNEVSLIIKEFSNVRVGSHQARAMIHGGGTSVTFFAGDRSLTWAVVYACKTYELAPVSGKRFFTYQVGFKNLPVLAGKLPVRPSTECNDA